MNFFKIIILFISLKTFAQISGSFDNKINLSDFPFTVTIYNNKHGLIQNQIDGICKLPNNNYLISNFNNLLEFDGINFKPWTNDRNLNTTLFTYFYTYKDKVYGLRNAGLFQLKPTYKFISNCAAIYLENGNIHRISKTGKIFNKEKFIFQLNNKYLSTIYNNLAYINGKYFIGTNKGFIVVNSKTKEQLNFLTENIRYIKKVNEKIFVLTNNMVYVFENNTLKKIINKFEYKQYNDICKLDNFFLITSHFGIYIYDTITKKTTFYDEKKLPIKSFNKIVYDSNSECILISTPFNGLVKLQKKKCKTIYSDSKETSNPFLSIIKTKNKKIYSISQNNLVQIEKDKFTKIYPQRKYIYSVFENQNNLYLNNSETETLVIDNNFKAKEELKLNSSNGVFIDKDKKYWVLNLSGVLYGNSLNTVIRFEPKKINTNAVSIYEKSNGDILIGGENKFYLISESKNNKKYIKNIYAVKGQVRSFYEIAPNRILVGTNGDGLLLLQNEKLTNLSTKKNSFIGNEVFTLAKDKFNNLIMSSNNGLRVVNIKSLINFIENKTDYLIPYKYDEYNGIYNTEFNGGFVNNYCTLDSINFYFPSAQGVTRFTSSKINPNPTFVNVSEIKIDDKKLNEKDILKIEQNFNELIIKFSSINLAESKNLMYQYKLEKDGENKNWSIPQKENFIKLSQLSFGEYRLKLRCIDASNTPKPIETLLRFNILPKFYETSTFSIFIICVFTLIVILIAFSLFQRKKRELIIKNNINLQIKDAELRAIHAQMNPHFIFNTLQTINNAINKREYENAEKILIDFSKLLRLVLEKSDKNIYTIREELEFIKLYLDLQSARFNKKIDIQITCNKKNYEYKIPTLLIQPIVENSIIHGLFHLNNSIKKQIKIDFIIKNNVLEIIILDNGIGRKASAKINEYRSHNSKGMELINKKISLIKSKYNVTILFSIIDIENDSETGTIVKLKIIDYDKLSDN